MDVRDIVREHYGRAELTSSILRALSEAGVTVDPLATADLAAVDQLHAGFLPATQHLLDALDLDARSRLLDVGSGIGGPARAAAVTCSCQVTGADLTPEFVSTATELTRLVGLSELVRFTTSTADRLPFPDGSFDRAMMIHVGMNVPDKRAVFAEVRRVLVDGGRFALYDQMRVADGPLPFPMPWADAEDSSFVESSQEYAEHLTAAGFAIDDTQDRTAQASGPPPAGDGPRIGPEAVFGAAFMARIHHNIEATSAGLLAPVLMVAHAV